MATKQATAETKMKQSEANQGLKKLTEKQEKAIMELWKNNDPKFQEVKKLVHKSILYKLTGDVEFAPKANRNERAEKLNAILFS